MRTTAATTSLPVSYYGRRRHGRLVGVIRVRRNEKDNIDGVWVAQKTGWMASADSARGLFTGDMGPEDLVSRIEALAFLRTLGAKPDAVDG